MIAKLASAAVILVMSGMAVSCQDQEAQTADVDAVGEVDTITATLAGASDLSTSSRLIKLAELGQALDGEGSYTIFMPVDEAWSALEAEALQSLELAESRPQLVAVLRQHIASGTVLQADMDAALEQSGGSLGLATMGAAPLTLRREGQAIFIGNDTGSPKIIGAPIMAGNDVIYRIDQLIPPPE